MRKLLLLLTLSLALGATAQQTGSVRIYGYMRPSHPGIVPASHPNATLADYLVYLAIPRNGGFRLRTVSIGGKAYEFRTEALASPVSYVNRNLPQNPRTETLVPKHSGRTFQVLIDKAPNRPGAGPLRLVYNWNGKTYSKTLKEWKELEPVMNQ
ncbi:hypothetical protein EPD60_09970 [Flaviaesturariibacter flavus]|uniref:DUF2846 domain-containing protein n=1 Tax=Flaviaesturariibacter flavus TaxID=2502780 RepID=A0A4R1BBD4_9BACT|nr:hypothetical protein [Flaviaesturariibacter flavus]TCJ14315.1 hypothetical protein EPD60_09970 [Flaviaesturariibacter flavus]